MVKVNKGNKFNIESAVESINRIVPVEFDDIDIRDCGYFCHPDDEFPKGIIIINQNHSPIVQFQSVVHEFAHFVDIVERGNANNAVIDAEVVAFAAENIIVNNVPVHVAINAANRRVREDYNVGFVPCCVEPEDVIPVVERIRAVIE